MRRSLGGLILIAAAVLIALSIGGWWLQRVAFSPSNDSNATYSILGDEEIRGQIATIVAGADAPILGVSPARLREDIERYARIPDGAALMSDFVSDAHGRVIGTFDRRVAISAQEQVNIVRNELVGEADPLTLPVQRVSSMAFLHDWLGWLALSSLVFGVIASILGMLLRPERGEGTFALTVFFASTAGSLVIFGYLVPLLLLPAVSNNPWMGVFPRLANHHRNLTLLLAVASLVIAALIAIGTSSRRERRQHSTPLNVGQYRDNRSWSR
jgi:hypothetical protein